MSFGTSGMELFTVGELDIVVDDMDMSCIMPV